MSHAVRQLLLLLLAACGGVARPLKDLQYAESMAMLNQLALINPKLAIFDADILTANWTTPSPRCKLIGDCLINPILRLTDDAVRATELVTARRRKPTALISGTIHGNERLGAVIVLHFVQWLLSQQSENVYARWLLSRRDVYVVPFANIDGYIYRTREDRGIDPNRDSPFAQAECPKTRTGELLYHLISNKLFLAGITFHGGMRSISYPWGSPRHYRDGKSTESPDHAMHADIAQQLKYAAGLIPLNLTESFAWLDAEDAREPSDHSGFKFFYPSGPTNSLVYPVTGSVEDWAYAGGWDDVEMTGCAPPNSEKHLRFPFFLVETDDNKNPSPSLTYGETAQISALTPLSGHIPRNIRLILRLIEMLQPEAVLLIRVVSRLAHLPLNSPVIEPVTQSELQAALVNDLEGDFEIITESDSGSDILSLRVFFTGCTQVQDIIVTVGPTVLFRDSEVYTNLCSSFGGWGLKRALKVYKINLPIGPQLGGVVQVSARFDQHWAMQNQPDPLVPPQSHLARLRLDPEYEVRGFSGDLVNAPQKFPHREDSVNTNHRLRINAKISIRGMPSIMRLGVICSERQNTTCSVTCEGCSTFSKHACAERGSYISTSLQGTLRSHHLFKIPLKDGVYEGALANHDLDDPEALVISAWCDGQKIYRIWLPECLGTCEQCLVLDSFSDGIVSKCDSRLLASPYLQSSRFKPVVNFAAFALWLLAITATHLVIKRL